MLNTGMCAAAAAAFVFFSATARARVVPARLTYRSLGVGRADDFHQLLAGLAGFDKLGEFLEVGLAVREKCFQACAQIIQPGFAVGGIADAILGAAAVAHAKHFAFATILR